jgi:hypothetical protein
MVCHPDRGIGLKLSRILHRAFDRKTKKVATGTEILNLNSSPKITTVIKQMRGKCSKNEKVYLGHLERRNHFIN